MSSAEKLKIQNLRSIFEICMPQSSGVGAQQNSVMVEEEEKNGDIEMIDSSSRNPKG